MDPFEALDPFLFELVVQHFTGEELLKSLSLVSPAWKEIVGTSKTCMSKVKFSYQAWRHQLFSSTDVFKIATKSCRSYQNIILDLAISDDMDQFWNFIESKSRSIAILKVENVRMTDNIRSGLEFPNLETFRAFGIDEASLAVFLTSPSNLKDLFIFVSDLAASKENVVCVLRNCLRKNNKLKTLYLKNTNLLEVFNEDLKSSFMLKTLKLMSTSYSRPLTASLEENLMKFLQQQSQTLEVFFFEYPSLKIAEVAFNDFAKLTSLGILDFPDINLQRNQNLKVLEIPFTEEISTIKNFVSAAPRLERLLVGLATNELIEHLAWNAPNLRSLNFKMISLDGEDFYENLKNEHPEVNQNIEIWDEESEDWD